MANDVTLKDLDRVRHALKRAVQVEVDSAFSGLYMERPMSDDSEARIDGLICNLKAAIALRGTQDMRDVLKRFAQEIMDITMREIVYKIILATAEGE